MPGRAKAAESASPDSRFFSGIRRFPERSEAPAEPSRITAALNTVILSVVRRQPNEVEGPRLSWQHNQPTENFHHRPIALRYPHRECRNLSSGISPQDDVFVVGSRWSATRRNHMEHRASPPDGRARCPSTPKTRHSQAQSAPPPIRSSGAAFRSPDTWSLQTGSRSRDKLPRSRRYQWPARTDRTSSSSQAAGLCDNLDKQNLHGAAPSTSLREPGRAAVLPSNS